MTQINFAGVDYKKAALIGHCYDIESVRSHNGRLSAALNLANMTSADFRNFIFFKTKFFREVEFFANIEISKKRVVDMNFVKTCDICCLVNELSDESSDIPIFLHTSIKVSEISAQSLILFLYLVYPWR